ncbi:MAG: hypothetical protein LRY63_03925 [Nitrincola sp.]|nr:hypothetical protein [Nitrincola sp.]
MSILSLKKISLVGLTEHKLQLLDALQQLGVMHVIPLKETEQREVSEEVVNPERLKRALQYLLSSREKRRQVVRFKQFNLGEMLDRIDHNRSQRLDLMSRRDFLEKRIKDLTPWGDFVFPDLADLAGHKLWFYLVPNYKMPAVERSGLTWTCVYRDNRNAYVVVLSEHEPDANRMPVARTLTGTVPLSQLEQNLEDLEIELEAVEAEREALTRWIYQCSVVLQILKIEHRSWKCQIKRWIMTRFLLFKAGWRRSMWRMYLSLRKRMVWHVWWKNLSTKSYRPHS